MLNYFNFKKYNSDHFLITNDFGCYSFLSQDELHDLVHGTIDQDTALYDELCDNGFVLPDSKAELLDFTMSKYRQAKSYLFNATSLHIFVLTNECNLCCVYCQARDHEHVIPQKMSLATAERSVNVALQSPEKHLNFEFQGGEPLLNFGALKHIVEYSEAHKGSHQITYSVVTNLLSLTDEMIDFFALHDVRVSTSLDGPELVHNMNRSNRSGVGSYSSVVSSIKKLKSHNIPVGAIQTTTKHSLPYFKEIIDTYVSLGFDGIFIRPLTKLGTALMHWDGIGYTAQDFLKFYQQSLSYILELNKSGVCFHEGHASIFLSKILKGISQNYMELRSPCGAALGQVAYYFNGDVYTCDEGRMLAEMGDQAFKLGNVFENTYDQLMATPVCKSVCLSSTLECLPECADCVYQPYCGTCPVLNYSVDHNIFKRDSRGYRCSIYKGMLDTIFDILYQNKDEDIEILKSW